MFAIIACDIVVGICNVNSELKLVLQASKLTLTSQATYCLCNIKFGGMEVTER